MGFGMQDTMPECSSTSNIPLVIDVVPCWHVDKVCWRLSRHMASQWACTHQEVDEDGHKDAARGVGGVAQLSQQGLAVQHAHLPPPAAYDLLSDVDGLAHCRQFTGSCSADM